MSVFVPITMSNILTHSGLGHGPPLKCVYILKRGTDLHGASLEMDFADFTLYFLAFNHSGNDLTTEEKDLARFSREGQHRYVFPIPFLPI